MRAEIPKIVFQPLHDRKEFENKIQTVIFHTSLSTRTSYKLKTKLVIFKFVISATENTSYGAIYHTRG